MTATSAMDYQDHTDNDIFEDPCDTGDVHVKNAFLITGKSNNCVDIADYIRRELEKVTTRINLYRSVTKESRAPASLRKRKKMLEEANESSSKAKAFVVRDLESQLAYILTDPKTEHHAQQYAVRRGVTTYA